MFHTMPLLLSAHAFTFSFYHKLKCEHEKSDRCSLSLAHNWFQLNLSIRNGCAHTYTHLNLDRFRWLECFFMFYCTGGSVWSLLFHAPNVGPISVRSALCVIFNEWKKKKHRERFFVFKTQEKRFNNSLEMFKKIPDKKKTLREEIQMELEKRWEVRKAQQRITSTKFIKPVRDLLQSFIFECTSFGCASVCGFFQT